MSKLSEQVHLEESLVDGQISTRQFSRNSARVMPLVEGGERVRLFWNGRVAGELGPPGTEHALRAYRAQAREDCPSVEGMSDAELDRAVVEAAPLGTWL